MSQNVAFGKKTEVALALAGGASIAIAAERFDMARRTIERWMHKPGFRRMVAKYRDQMVATAVGRMADNMTQAADALVGLLAEKEPAVRLRAARAVLSLGLRMRDAADVGERLRAVETELDRHERGMP